MEKLIIFFVIWMIWRFARSAIEKSRQQNQPPPTERPSPRPAQVQQSRLQAPTEAIGRTERAEVDRPTAKGVFGDMERLFQEAMEQKRRAEEGHQGQRPRPGQPRTARPRVMQPQPEPESWIPRQPAPEPESWVPRQEDPEPESWVPRQPSPEPESWVPRQPEPRRVARPAKPPAKKPAEALKPPPEKAKKRRKRRERPRQVARAKPVTAIPIIGKLSQADVRRGIVLAEVLGPPKALRDIDSHII